MKLDIDKFKYKLSTLRFKKVKQCSGGHYQKELPFNARYFRDDDGLFSGLWFTCLSCGTSMLIREKDLDEWLEESA